MTGVIAMLFLIMLATTHKRVAQKASARRRFLRS